MAATKQAILQLLKEQSIDYVVREHEPIYTVAEGKAIGLPNSKQR